MAGFLNRLLGRPASVETRSSIDDFYMAAGTSYEGGSGPVTAIAAESLATVYACTAALAGGLGSLPVYVYRSNVAGRIEAPEHPVSRLLRMPNRHQTWPDFLEWLVGSLVLQGNALAIIEHDGRGNPIALQPVPWGQVAVVQLTSGRLAYSIMATTARPTRTLLDGEVLHVKERSDDGLVGRSRLSRAAPSVQAALSLQDYSASVWKNAATPSGMLTVPAGTTPDGMRRIKQQVDQAVGGHRKAGKIFYADADSKFIPLQMTPGDTEVLESRRFSAEELCRLMNVPPPIVQEYSHNTFTSSAQANIWFATNSLRPIARKIEAEFSRSVFAVDDAHHLELDLSGLLRGDADTRWASHKIAVEAGILDPDEIREVEGWAPRDTAPPAGVADTAPVL
jgi:HK97 family phage portal protein